MPTLTIEKGQNGEAIEVNVCLASGCIEYYEDKEQIRYDYNEHILGREKAPEETTQITKVIRLIKRENYKDYLEKLIENYVIHFDEGNLPKDVKKVYDVYKFVLEQCKNNPGYVGIKIEGKTERGVYIYSLIRCDERSGRTRVIVDFKVETHSESLLYYYDTMTVDSAGILKREVERVMVLFTLFSEYVSQGTQSQNQQGGQVQEKA